MFSVIIIVTWNIPGERIIIFFLPFIMLAHTHVNNVIILTGNAI